MARRREGDESQLGFLADLAGPNAAPPAEAAPVPAPEAPAEPAPDAAADGPLPDEDARRRIREDLDTNLLVEAGAGSGKTTALVDRMVALVVSDTAAVDEVAAVTFTRKAAAELQQRFQTRIEKALVEAREAGRHDDAERLDRALRGIHRAFIGTIHSFCARLLRERPVEAGLDPGFEELMGVEEQRLRRSFWRGHLERLAGDDDPLAAELMAVGLAPSRVMELFDALVANPDVEFPAEPVLAPTDEEVDAVRRRLDALLDRGLAMMPAEPDPDQGWDDLQKRIRLLRFQRRVVDWRSRTDFLEVLGEEVVGRGCKVVQKRWPDGGAAKALSEEWEAELKTGAAESLMDRWWAHRYPIAMAFARRAADEFEAERVRTGRLNFQDLLVRAARLLREHEGAREELGRRYRRLLVDEFQDTDPVQAEVLMLLASPADGEPWQRATPRPGALFVVGDPKQSIYRFRRADIAVYNLVRERFERFGDVVELVANFRSLPGFEGLVGDVFAADDVFPDRATPYQAAFAPLRTRREPDPDRELIGQFVIEPDGRSKSAMAEDGSARLAKWVAGEIEAGRRGAGDFLVLARQKSELATYARALEAWGVPVQVTGAGVDRSEELRELLVLLDALADPTDPVLVVAALVGLFFGLDLDDLLDWTLEGDAPEVRRRFDITDIRDAGDGPVGDALRTLNGWWRESRATPADILVARIVDSVGLIPLAASRDLGELRAGSLLFALDTLRVAALHGDTSIATAREALATALESDDAEAPLEPVRKGVARVMTLHQAKGLEAPVVVLVQPRGQKKDHPITSHVTRGEDGSAVGYLVVQEKVNWRTRVIARPEGWAEKEAEERRYDDAEQERLLYVAATRARDALLVARSAGKNDSDSPWARLYPWIDRHGQLLPLDPAAPPDPEVMDRDGRDLVATARGLAERRLELAVPAYRVTTATALARAGTDTEAPPDVDPARYDPSDGSDASFRGISWGSAVHAALDAAARGAAGAALRVACRSILMDAERPTRDGEPTELDELLGLVESVMGSELWARAERSERMLSEVPFAFHADPDEAARLDPESDGTTPLVVEGVVDLAFREEGGWVIVDYKTDIGTDSGFAARESKYRRQVDLYARVWAEMTGEPVVERGLYFTARPETERLVPW